MYQKELLALKRANRFRKREIFKNLKDFASNDYLALASKKSLLKKSFKELKNYPYNSPKASLLVNGYTKFHKRFEEELCKYNGFESGIVLGSGFLANIALIEALPRRGDLVLIDEEFHASGILASKLTMANVKFFRHNDANDLEKKIKNVEAKRVFIVVEGVYSMSGDILNYDIFDVADRKEAVFIVDEAHSSGVIGKNLLGVFDCYDKEVKENYIKMGTLGKAYGSYGAYILANKEIISFLENRAKPIIYTTALSLFDTILAHNGFRYIQKNKDRLRNKIDKRKEAIKSILNTKISSMILPIEVKSNSSLLKVKEELLRNGYIVGAIRPPTVKKPMLRVIPRLEYSKKDFIKLLKKIRDVCM